jgi:hypothetical protein
MMAATTSILQVNDRKVIKASELSQAHSPRFDGFQRRVHDIENDANPQNGMLRSREDAEKLLANTAELVAPAWWTWDVILRYGNPNSVMRRTVLTPAHPTDTGAPRRSKPSIAAGSIRTRAHKRRETAWIRDAIDAIAAKTAQNTRTAPGCPWVAS